MRLGEPEREAYDNWGKLELPTWKDLVLEARLDAIDSSAWLFDLKESSLSTFEYEGIPLGKGERQAYKKWQQPAQPTWEDLVVNARIAELDPSAWIADERDPSEEVEGCRSVTSKRDLECAIDQGESSSSSFTYDGMRLGASERAAYENWTKPERPSWEDLILDARRAVMESPLLSSSSIGETSSSVFLYEGMSLGDAEGRAYERWRQSAQSRWQNLVVNARLAELNPSVWILDEHDPLEEAKTLSLASQASIANKSNNTLSNQSESGCPDLAYEAVQETARLHSSTCSQLETRCVLHFESSGQDANQTESIAYCDRFDGGGKIKRLGAKSRRAVSTKIQGVNFSAQGRLSEDGGQAVGPFPSKQTTRSRSDNISTYGSRKNE